MVAPLDDYPLHRTNGEALLADKEISSDLIGEESSTQMPSKYPIRVFFAKLRFQTKRLAARPRTGCWFSREFIQDIQRRNWHAKSSERFLQKSSEGIAADELSIWSGRPGSNRRHSAWEVAGQLQTENIAFPGISFWR
jgi:hypothetical protein